MADQVQQIVRPITVVRNVPMVELEIESRVDQPLPNGMIAREGKSVVTVYKDELPQVKALVEPNPEGIEKAKAEDAIQLEMAIKDNPDNAEYIRTTWSGSMSAAFQKLYHRDLLPLKSVKVLRDDIPPPHSEAFNLEKTIANAFEKGLQAVLEKFTAPSAGAQHQQTKRS